MRDVHPTSTAKSGQVPGNESHKVYCKHCGFPCDIRKNALKEKGDGISHSSTGDPTVNSGCPFCGSYNYK
jgi:hypothetical protein